MSFASLASAWLFALLLPVTLFYFLKLKRPRVEIPSLVLWRQVLSDQRVNSPFQRFKRHLLLLLQLLLLALLALAAMQPFLRGDGGGGNRQAILIDVSASMAALDREGGRTRLDEARQRVRERIDGLLPGQEISLIAFARHARRLTPFTDNRRDLRAALDALEIEEVPSDLEEALRTAQALARSASFDKLLLYSDGNFPAQTYFELPFAVDFQRLGAAGANVGITACEARRGPDGRWNVFVQLEASTHSEGSTAVLELLQDGQSIATENVTVTPDRGSRLSFTVANGAASTIHAHLSTTGFDSLSADNDAWLTLPAVRPLAVYVPPKLTGYRHVLSAIPNLEVFPAAGRPLPAAFDLLISDITADLDLPARVRCGIGIVPEDVRPLLTIENRSAQAIDWRRDSPLLQHVSLDDVVFTDDPVLTAGTDDSRFANLGYEILARSAHGPLILGLSGERSLCVYLLFHTDRSTLPYRVGFPVFVANLVQTALQNAGLAEAAAGRTGVLPPVSLTPGATYLIDGPHGLHRTELADERGSLSGVPAAHAGDYAITGPGTNALHLGVSLLSPEETSLTAVEQIEFADHLVVQAAKTPVRIDRPLWWPLAALGFGLLLVEWWWFQRCAGAIR